MDSQPPVAAEVLLKRGAASSSEVAAKLASLGLDVVSLGKVSISIEGSPEQFEKIFGARLVSVRENTSPARDFGSIGRNSDLRSIGPLHAPTELEDDVAAIEIQQAPRMMY